jgi:hypothetical protein
MRCVTGICARSAADQNTAVRGARQLITAMCLPRSTCAAHDELLLVDRSARGTQKPREAHIRHRARVPSRNEALGALTARNFDE